MKAILTIAALAALSTPKDFAYRMQVTQTSDAAAYRVALPLAVYQKAAHPDLADLRVFNGNGELVPFAIEKPAAARVVSADTHLPVFPLKDDSDATLAAVKLTLESGKSTLNFQSGGQAPGSDRIARYLVDGRALDTPVASLILAWPQDAADFAGRVRVEASDSLSDWRVVCGAAPIANLHSTIDRLVEQRVEFPATRAKFWRLSWVGNAAPFVLTSVGGRPADRNADVLHASMTVAAAPAKAAPGEFAYDLGATVPVDRINLDLPDINSVIYVELLSRAHPRDAWHSAGRKGFYRLKTDGAELRNGPVDINPTTDRYWLLRTDPGQGGLGTAAPRLAVEWVPNEVVFVARGPAPFSISYGSYAAAAAAVSLAMLPQNLTIAGASLSPPEASGGESLLRPPADPFPWKTPLLWALLIGGAGLLGWMALRLSKDVATK